MIAVLDSNVLYSAPVRDLLLNLADAKQFQPKWSDQINEEWTRNLLLNRPDIRVEALQKTVVAMNIAFPDASVAEDITLKESLDLPDPNDVHVLMAAIVSNAEYIITANIKDFPATGMAAFNITAVHPDDFVVYLFEIQEEIVKEAFKKMVAKLKNPPKTHQEVLAALAKCGMQKTVNLLSLPPNFTPFRR